MHPATCGSAGSFLVLAASSHHNLERRGSRLLHRLVTDSAEMTHKLDRHLTVSLHINDDQRGVLRSERSIMRPVVWLSTNLPGKWLCAHIRLALRELNEQGVP